MKIGFMELLVVFIVALLAIGPDKLPSFARKLGLALREFRKVSADMTKDVRENVIEPLEEAQRPIREAMEPLEDLNKEIRGDLRAVEKDLKNLGKPAPQKPAAQSAPEAESVASPEEAEPQESAPAEQSDDRTGGEEI